MNNNKGVIFCGNIIFEALQNAIYVENMCDQVSYVHQGVIFKLDKCLGDIQLCTRDTQLIGVMKTIEEALGE